MWQPQAENWLRPAFWASEMRVVILKMNNIFFVSQSVVLCTSHFSKWKNKCRVFTVNEVSIIDFDFFHTKFMALNWFGIFCELHKCQTSIVVVYLWPFIEECSFVLCNVVYQSSHSIFALSRSVVSSTNFCRHTNTCPLSKWWKFGYQRIVHWKNYNWSIKTCVKNGRRKHHGRNGISFIT